MAKEQLTELQKIILEILLEQKDNTTNMDDLINEALKRQQRIEQLSDIK